jgi:hypothetical protein
MGAGEKRMAMKTTFKMALALSTALALVAPAAVARSAAEIDKSDNVKHLANVSFKGGTELAASGNYVYAGELNGNTNRGQDPEKGGVRILDVSKGGKPVQVGFLHCPGTDNDVEVVKPGLLVVSFSTNVCAPAAGNGLMTVDVKNPRKPKVLGSVMTGKNHTHKPVPGTTLVYTAGGGLAGGPSAGPAIVDVKDPRNPEVVARPGIQTLTTDCHDISFSFTKERKLGFCAGAIGTGEVQIWNMEDPLKPTLISKIHNPLIQYSHYAVASSDGKLLAIDDEAFALHECVTGQTPTGRVWIYDISNPQVPIPQSSYAAPRGGGPGVGTLPGWAPSWCLSHGLDWLPNSRNLAVTWFTGGLSVLNLDNPLLPSEVAHFKADDSLTYSVLWHKGYLYSNGFGRGVDGFSISGLAKQ